MANVKSLAVCLVIVSLAVCVPGAAAEETGLFPQEEVASVLSGQSDHTVTIEEMEAEFVAAAFPSYYEFTDTTARATVQDLLYAFSSSSRGQFCRSVDNKFLYPAGNSMWLSSAEWSGLVSDLTAPVSLSTVRIVLQRAVDSKAFLMSHYTPSTYQDYADAIQAFFPEFSELTASNRSAVEYWMQISGNSSVYYANSFSSVLHECAHEQSARMSGVFVGRKAGSSSWAVEWKCLPETMYYYDLKSQNWLSVKVQSVPTANKVLPAAPSDVQQSVYYKAYTRDGSVANDYGIYGILQEVCSCAIDVRVRVVSSSLNYHYRSVDESFLQEYYWWKGDALHYMEGLRTKQPKVYQALMQDEAFTSIWTDTFDYAEQQLALAKIVEDQSVMTLALKAYANELDPSSFLQAAA
jgi:hypothetical protein